MLTNHIIGDNLKHGINKNETECSFDYTHGKAKKRLQDFEKTMTFMCFLKVRFIHDIPEKDKEF